MSILSATLGRFVPRYRTLGEWAETYSDIVARRPLQAKTLANRRGYIRRIVESLGDRRIGAILPHEIGAVIGDLAKAHPVAAKRTLTELRDMLNEAMLNGWIERNPAAAVRPPRVRVARRRLALEEFRAIHAWSVAHQPPWCARLFVLAVVTGQRRGDLLAMRFSDVWDGHLHVIQQKTGARLALPCALRLDAIGVSIGEAVEACRSYGRGAAAADDALLIRKSTGAALSPPSASWRFEVAREGALGLHQGDGDPASLHELRSLSEREYRARGVNTQTLLGHTRKEMTDLYNNSRGLDARLGKWRTLELPKPLDLNSPRAERDNGQYRNDRLLSSCPTPSPPTSSPASASLS